MVELPGFIYINLAAYAMIPRCSWSSSAISDAVRRGSTPNFVPPSNPVEIFYNINVEISLLIPW